jgi:hypothetical protein
MDWSKLADWATLGNILQAVVVILVGLWGYFKFRKQRTHHPHIEFSVDCNVYGLTGDKEYAAEFLVNIKNHGYVQQKFKEIILRAHATSINQTKLMVCKESDKKELHGKGYDERLYLPEKLIDEVDIIPDYYKPYIVEPGCEETVRYVTRIPPDIKYMLVHAEYLYPNTKRATKKSKHYAETLFQNLIEKIKLAWYGYPNRPRTTEKLILVEPRQTMGRSAEDQII